MYFGDEEKIGGDQAKLLILDKRRGKSVGYLIHFRMQDNVDISSRDNTGQNSKFEVKLYIVHLYKV